MTVARRLQLVALLLTGLSLLVVAVSAYLRLEEAGLGCVGWPACYGRLPTSEQSHFTPLRIAHRSAASLSLLLAIYLVWQCRRSPTLAVVARPANWLLRLMLALAVLGIWSGEPRLMPIVFLNLLGGLGLVSFSWRTFLATASATPKEPTTPLPPTLRFGTLTLTLTVLCGAAIGAGQLATACTIFPGCDGQWWPSVGDWATLFAFPDWHPSNTSGKTLHLLHRYAALVSVLLLGHGAWTIWRSGKRRLATGMLVSLLVGTATLGIATLINDFSLWSASAHVLCAAALLAAVATVHKR